MSPARRSVTSVGLPIAGVLALVLNGCSGPPPGFDWNPTTAANYLDHRAKAWMHSRRASRDRGTACLSCHTTVPYALARSELSRILGELSPPIPQQELLDTVKKRVALWPQLLPWYRDEKVESRGTEAVLNALILSEADASRGHLSPATRAALDDMWALQRVDGPKAGSWPWIQFNNEPWEAPDSDYYGATLAALATGLAPDGYSRDPAIQEPVSRLRDYLRRTYPDQTLLNRIDLLWVAGQMPDLVDSEVRTAILSEISARQHADGGWSTASLMPSWKRHDGSSPPDVSDGYATGLISLVLQESGVPTSDARLRRSLAWLEEHQSRWNGRWSADSPNGHRGLLNEARPFMDDAATAFAVLALVRAQPQAVAARARLSSPLTPISR
jgi:squalene-hopene/tetraprenyl-beta-curcumene cyclase